MTELSNNGLDRESDVLAASSEGRTRLETRAESMDSSDAVDVVEGVDDATMAVGFVNGLTHQHKHLGPYVIEAMIGRGAMGTVYRAEHVRLKRKVALKIVPPELTSSPQRRRRFQREMEAVGRLDHPNLVRATDAGEVDGTQYLVMELIDAIDLGKRLRRIGAFDVGSACEVARQVAVGLEHIASNHLVHRDIKPSNLLVTQDGTVKILDLGIAMLRHDDGQPGGTTFQGVMGTPDYVAPEQVSHANDVDIRADIYSLGCTLYTLLVGQAPFDGPDHSTGISKLIAHTNAVPTSLKELRSDLPSRLIAIVDRMMAKKPSERFESPRDVVAALSPFADHDALCHLIERSDAAPSSPTTPVNTIRSCKGTCAGNCSTTERSFCYLRKLQRHHVGSLAVATLVALGVMAIPRHAHVERLEQSASNAAEPSALGSVPATTDRAPDADTTTRLAAVITGDSDIAEIVDNSSEIRQHTEQLTQSGRSIDESTQRIADSLDELRSALTASSENRGIIASPQTNGELYHNARLHEAMGNPALAVAAYRKLLETHAEYVDVHLRFQQLVTLQEGVAGARRVYRSLPEALDTTMRRFALSLLEDGESREVQLQGLVNEFPDFAPAHYELSRCASRVLVGEQTLQDKINEKQRLAEFLRQVDEGQYLKYFLDPTIASEWVADAQARLRLLNRFDEQLAEQPVSLQFSAGPKGWTVSIQVSEPTRELRYRLPGDEQFTSTGFLEQRDPRTQAPVPISVITLPAPDTSDSLEVDYVDLQGNRRGPFQLSFDLQRERIHDARRRLMLTRQQWAEFTPEGELSFRYLARFRDVIKQVRYGVDAGQPTEVFELPANPTDLADLVVPLPADAQTAVVQVVFINDESTEVTRIPR